MKRLGQLQKNLTSSEGKKRSTLSVKDNRTGKSYEFKIDQGGFIRGTDLLKIKHNNQVLRCYDPGYKNTMNCTSRITFIEGAKGIPDFLLFVNIVIFKKIFLVVLFFVFGLSTKNFFILKIKYNVIFIFYIIVYFKFY